MESIRNIQKKYCSNAMVLAIIFGFFLIIFSYEAIGKGLILGTLFSVINFVLMGESLPTKIGHTKGKTFLMALGSIFVRYFFIAIPMIVGIKFDQFNLFAVVFGIFMVQLMILFDHIFNLVNSSRTKSV